MKKNLVWIILTLAIVICCMYWYKNQNNRENKTKILAVLPLTGEYAQYGENDKKGILLALDVFKIDTSKVDVIFVDNKGTAKDALIGLKKELINADKSLVIIDDAMSNITEVLIPESRKSKIPIISTGATNPKFSGISPYFFRVWNSDAEEGAFAAQMAHSILNFKRLNLVYLDNIYGNGLKSVFTNHYEKEGYSIAQSVAIPEKSNDYKSVITKINNDAPIYFVGYSNELGLFAKTLRQQNKNNQILATVAAEDPKVIDIAGNAAEGIIYVYNAEINNPTYLKFKDEYEKKYNEAPQILTDVAYDAIYIIKEALNKNILNGEDLAVFLRNMPEFEGASGNIKFDKNGDVHKKMILKQIKNKNFEYFQ